MPRCPGSRGSNCMVGSGEQAEDQFLTVKGKPTLACLSCRQYNLELADNAATRLSKLFSKHKSRCQDKGWTSMPRAAYEELCQGACYLWVPAAAWAACLPACPHPPTPPPVPAAAAATSPTAPRWVTTPDQRHHTWAGGVEKHRLFLVG